MSRKILWHTVAQNKIGGYLFKGDDPLYYGDDPIYRVQLIEGPSVLQHGVTGTYVVQGGWEPSLVSYDANGATIGDTTSTGFTLTLNNDVETASVKVYYGGLLIDTVSIQCAPEMGEVTGATYLDQGESAFYAHNLGPTATYTGTLVLVSQSDDGAVLQMPEDADVGVEYVASWSGLCGATASMGVDALPPCGLEYDAIAYLGVWNGGGAPPIPGGKVRIVDYPYNGGDSVFTVGSFYNEYRIVGGSQATGAWRVTFASGVGTLISVCVGLWPGTSDPKFYSYFLISQTRCP